MTTAAQAALVACYPTLEDALDSAIEQEDITVGALDYAGKLMFEIPLAPSPYWSWYQEWWLPDGRKYISGNLDYYYAQGNVTVAGYTHWGYIDNDFSFVATYKNGYPTKIEPWYCDGNANSVYTDFRINHKPIWGGEIFGDLFAAGHNLEMVDVYNEARLNETLGQDVDLGSLIDFGTTTLGTAIQFTFAVYNTGTDDLTTSDLSVPIGYSIIEGLSASIGLFDTFTVQIDALVLGTYTGEISFTNGDENLFNFAITGTVTPEPATLGLLAVGLSALFARRRRAEARISR